MYILCSSLILFFIGLATLNGCTGYQPQLDQIIQDRGFERLVILGDGFTHLAFYRSDTHNLKNLRIYFEGDGSPWRTPTLIADDPTPRDPLALRLMALDPGPALYLGRPCYHGLANESNCHPWLWTQGRYAEPIVVSMTTAISRFCQEQGYETVTLIGYSGGGVLAWLVAERLDNVTSLVTIAANLDIDAWTNLHGYTPLMGSMNPKTRPSLRPQVRQWHYLGSQDDNVPPAIILPFLQAQPGPVRIQVVDLDHRHGWEALSPRMMRSLGSRANSDP